MSVLMTDAQNSLSAAAKSEIAKGTLEDVLFADDTLVIGKSSEHVEEYMAAVERCGQEYGLSIHWGKVHFLAVPSDHNLKAPDGRTLPCHQSILYLGCTIHRTGKFTVEVTRKIGTATADFKTLNSVWKHAALSNARKLNIFEAVIVSRLLCCIASSWLSKGDLRKLDGFHVRCLRTILGIKPSLISRISNARVRNVVQQYPLSERIRRSQLDLLGRVIREPSKAVLKKVTFHKDQLLSQTDAWVRKVGRPRHEWTTQLTNMMKLAAGTEAAWQ
jgi:hypothetical protein